MIKLRELRESRSITQAELASALNISPSTIGMYEQGRRNPDPDTLLLIAEYFHISIDYLLGRKTSTDNKTVASVDNKEIGEIYDIYDKLSDEAKEKLLEYGSDLLGNPKNLK